MADDINQTLSELNATLSDLGNGFAECCTAKGGVIDPPPKNYEDPPIGPGEQFPDQASYFDAKCNAANAIYDQIKGNVDWLKNNNADLIAGNLGGLAAGLSLMFIIGGPVGWATLAAEAAVLSIGSFLIQSAINFEDLQTALADVHDECVEALYNASSAGLARSNFIVALEASTTGLSPVETTITSLMLNDEMLNELFNPRRDTAEYQSDDEVTCGSVLALWSFVASAESWTFRDDSTPNASATGSYDSEFEALSHDQVIIAGGPQRFSIAVDVSPTLAQVVVAGNSVQADHDATSDGFVVSRTLTVTYTDASEYSTFKSAHAGAGSIILDLTVAGTIETIELETARSNGAGSAGYTFTTKTLEVRIQ